MNTQFEIKCLKCYADKKADGSLIKINGLKVYGETCINYSGTTSSILTFENLFLSNWIFTKTGATSYKIFTTKNT